MTPMLALKKLTAVIVIAAFMAPLAPPAARADDSDIFGANIQPNVLILLDSSGSMDDSITSTPYVVATSYPVVNLCGRDADEACVATKVYQKPRSTYREYANNIASVSSAAARNALSTVGYWSGRISGSNVNLYTGNYLNYQLGVCSGGGCSEKKIDIAKRTLKDLVDSVTGVRFGFMKFWGNGSQGNGGGAMVAQMGTNATVMKASIDAVNPSGFTPLGEFVKDGGRYFKGQALTNGNTYTSPIQLSCQPNFIILISDGLQNGSVDVRTEATLRFTQDHATGGSMPGTQNVIVHTVGFGLAGDVDEAAANDVLNTAAGNGGGQFYSANNSAALEAALQDAIRRIIAATFTFATPVVPTTTTTGSSKAYLAAFQSDPSRPFWRGYLKAYQRDSNGLIPVDGNGVPLASALVWEAGQALSTMASSSRTIYTQKITTGNRELFTKANGNISTGMLGVASSTERDNVIDFVRGIDVLDEDKDSNTTEDRAWKFADVFHSTPVLVTPPVRGLADSSYQAFKTAQASRMTVLIAGANDGAVHAFKESDGTELWAFIPPDLLPGLKDLVATSGDHQFYVDSSPIAVDIKVSSAWKTIVVFGLRRGGNFYYALDITNTTDPQFMWSWPCPTCSTPVTDTKLGETWSEPSIGKVKIGGVDKWVMFVGGGYDTGTNNNTGKAFYVIDLSNGAKLWEYYNGSTTGDDQYMNFSLAANATAVDLNNDGYIDRVFVGDIGGQVWKFNVSGDATSSWTGKRTFAAAPSQANPPANGEFYPTQGIYGAPALAFDSSQNLWLFVGTGDRNHPNSTSSNRFYGIKEPVDLVANTDMANASVVTESSLADVTTADAANAPGGWFIQLASTEKVLAAANVFNNSVLFTTFTPTSTVTCTSGGGTAKLYAMSMTSGYASINFSTGASVTTTSASVARSSQIGTGIASMPVIVVTPPAGGTPAGASASAITLTTDQQTPATPLPGLPFLRQVRSWRERIQ